jgi:hypothetical protein
MEKMYICSSYQLKTCKTDGKRTFGTFDGNSICKLSLPHSHDVLPGFMMHLCVIGERKCPKSRDDIVRCIEYVEFNFKIPKEEFKI